jgi:membrane associated rhomboid family serine protease
MSLFLYTMLLKLMNNYQKKVSNIHPKCKITSSEEIIHIIYSGIAAGIVGFVAFASIHYPDTIIKRPHPIFWRVLLGILSLYAFFMTYVLY